MVVVSPWLHLKVILSIKLSLQIDQDTTAPNFELDSNEGKINIHPKDEDDSEFEPIPDKLVQYKSWVWHYGKLSFQHRNGKKEPRWHCNKCINKNPPSSLSTKSSTWIARHLQDTHQILKKQFLAPICPTMLKSEGTTVLEWFNIDSLSISRNSDAIWWNGSASVTRHF